MELSVIVAGIIACVAVIVSETGLYRVEYFVAVRMSAHVCLHICLIMIQEYRSGMPVMGREMTPVPGRMPRTVVMDKDNLEDGRSGVESRPDDKVGTVDERVSDDFHVVVVCAADLGDQCGNILEDVLCKNGLDDEDMVVTVSSLDYAEIVDISVPVEVKV